MKKSGALVTLNLIIAFGGQAASHRFDHSRLGLGILLKSGEFAVLHWSSAFADFGLEFSDTLAPFPIWEPLAVKPESTGTSMAVAIPITGTAKFFRLRKQ